MKCAPVSLPLYVNNEMIFRSITILAVINITLFLSFALASKINSSITQFDIQEIQKTIEISFPILTAREAVEFAKSKGLIDKPPYKELKEHGFKSWIVLAESDVDNWSVILKTNDLIPSYSCTMVFNNKGSIWHEECGYNK